MKEGYKKTELGWIPEEWSIVRVEDICDRNDKYSFTGGPFGSDLKSCHYTDDGVQVVQLQNIGEGYFNNDSRVYTSGEKADELKTCNIYPNDIIIAKMAEPVARACKIPDNRSRYLMCSDGIRVAVNRNKYDNDFILYSINSNYFRNNAIANSTGSTRLRIGLSALRNLTLIVPTLKEQQKIAEILSTVDSQICDTDRLIEKTKELKKGLMQRLLTKGIGHTEFKMTEVGEIPVEWEVKSLLEVANFKNGKAHEKNICEIGDFIVVNSKFISTGGEIQKYSNENISPLNKGDITLVMSDVPNGRAIGKCYLIDKDNKYTLNQRICCLRTEEMDKEFLFYYLNRNSYFLKFDDGAKQTNLRKEEVLGCPIRIPKIEEQKQIANILSSVDTQIEEYESKKVKLEELKKGLMQQLLTGEIRAI